MNTSFTRTTSLTYFYDKNPGLVNNWKVRTKTKIGVLVNTTPRLYPGYKNPPEFSRKWILVEVCTLQVLSSKVLFCFMYFRIF